MLDLNSVEKISDVYELRDLMGIGLKDLYRIINNIEDYYIFYKIPKKDKKYREIYEPCERLKLLQKWILKNILYKIPCSDFSMAYKKGVSLADNARVHLNQKYVLKIDLKDYFSTLKLKDVYRFFRKIGYDKKVSYILSNLCCLHGSLPQGAPTSPYLSNLLTYTLDLELNSYCKERDLKYTRYSDDIAISGDFCAKKIIPDIIKIIKKHNLFINYKKVVVIGDNKQQRITGIVVNEKLQVSKTYRKKIRQEIYYINKYGLKEHMKFNDIKDEEGYLNSLKGRINYCLQVNPDDIEMRRYRIFMKLF